MYMLAMFTMFVNVVVCGVVSIVFIFKNRERKKRTQEKRVEEWQNSVATNFEFPTQSQIWLQKVKEDEMRRSHSAGKKI